MSSEFEQRKNDPLPGVDDPIDAEALRFTQSWHRHPAIHDAVWYRGVNLGEVAEYLLLPEVIKVFLQHREKGE